MNKKPNNLDESNPFRIPGGKTPDDRLDDKPLARFINDFRADYLPSSQVSPSKAKIYQRLNYRLLLGIFLILIIIGLILYIFTGFGRPRLEKSLAGLISKEGTETPQIIPTQLTFTEYPPDLSLAAYPSPTIIPTWTPVKIIQLTSISTQKTKTSTQKAYVTKTPTVSPTQGCRNVQNITLVDVGKTYCVQGFIIETVEKPTNFMVIFSDQPEAFYWVTYDMVWSKGEVGRCYQTTGKIDQISNSPVLVFNYSNIPEECP